MSYGVAFASSPADPVLGAEALRSSRLSRSTIVCASACAPVRKLSTRLSFRITIRSPTADVITTNEIVIATSSSMSVNPR
jgi:hypothetical protein